MQADGADGLPVFGGEDCIEEAAQQLSLISKDDPKVYKLKGGFAQIRVRELPFKGLSFQIWPAAHALCWYLEETYGAAGMFSDHPSHKAAGGKPNASRRNLRVLELGAGTGMVGILCAVLGSHCTITDLPHVIPNLEHNARLNEDVFQGTGRGGSVIVRSLRWGERADIEDVGGSFDLIVASDVVYYDHLFEPLLCTLKWLLLSSSCQSTSDVVAEMKETTSSSRLRPSNALEGVFSFAATSEEATSIPQRYGGDATVESQAPSFCQGALEETAPPVVLLAHLRRWKKDSHFFRKANKLFRTTVVHKHVHDDTSRTGVTVYSFSRKKN